MDKKKLVLASDHAGFYLKNALVKLFTEAGYDVIDCGTDSDASCDYPVFAEKLCAKINSGEAELGILCCGTGIGMSMAANKIDGIRAAHVTDTYSARMTKEHNNANVIAFGARIVGSELAKDIVKAYLEAEFLGGRHAKRVAMFEEIEKRNK